MQFIHIKKKTIDMENFVETQTKKTNTTKNLIFCRNNQLVNQ